MPWPTGNFTAQGLIQARIVGYMHQQQTVNSFWFVLPSELGAPDWPNILADLAGNIITCAVTTLLPGVSSEWSFNNVTCTLMSSENKEQHIEPAPANSVGALGEGLPSTVAVVCSLRTPFIGKSRRGRIYIAGAPESGQDASMISGPTVAQLALFFTCLLNKYKWDSGTEDLKWVVFSPKNGFTAPSTYSAELDAIAPVNNVLIRSVLGTMRSRRIGSGA